LEINVSILLDDSTVLVDEEREEFAICNNLISCDTMDSYVSWYPIRIYIGENFEIFIGRLILQKVTI